MAISEQEFNERVRANVEVMSKAKNWRIKTDDPLVMEALIASAETAKRRWLNPEANYLVEAVERWLEANENL